MGALGCPFVEVPQGTGRGGLSEPSSAHSRFNARSGHHTPPPGEFILEEVGMKMAQTTMGVCGLSSVNLHQRWKKLRCLPRYMTRKKTPMYRTEEVFSDENLV